MSRKVDLYGGAITCHIPAHYVDVSTFRQVPDDQEVFLDPNSHDSIVFDLCERVEDEGGDESVFRFHASNLIEEEGGVRIGNILPMQVPKLPDGNTAFLGFVASHPDRKGRYHGILLLVIRLVQAATDAVVSINLPDLDEQEGEAFTEEGADGARFPVAAYMMRDVLREFQVQDWSLFIN